MAASASPSPVSAPPRRGRPPKASATPGAATDASKAFAKTSSKHEDKRTAILRTAAQLFTENGYENTSLDMIAERLGMHKATLYHYVRSKDSILYQCLVLSFADLEEVIASMADRSVPPLERLRHFVRSLALAQNNDFGRCLVLVDAKALDTSAHNEIRQFQQKLDTTVRALLTEGMADGSVKPCDASMVSAMLFGSLNWVPRWYSPRGRMTIPEIADTFMNMLAQGIAVAPTHNPR